MNLPPLLIGRTREEEVCNVIRMRRMPQLARVVRRCPVLMAMLRLRLAAHSCVAHLCGHLFRVVHLQGLIAKLTSALGCVWAKRLSWAGVAQLVEHLICNQRVGGSNPFVSSTSSKSSPELSEKARVERIWLYCWPVPARRPHTTPSRQSPARFETESATGSGGKCRVLRSKPVCKRCTGGRVVKGSRL